jgi:hypothetical protein
MPPDAKEARGYGVKLTRTKAGSITVRVEKAGGK